MSLFSFRAAGEGVSSGTNSPADNRPAHPADSHGKTFLRFTRRTLVISGFTVFSASIAGAQVIGDATLDSDQVQLSALQKSLSKLMAAAAPDAGLDGVNVTDAIDVRQLDAQLSPKAPSAPQPASSATAPILAATTSAAPHSSASASAKLPATNLPVPVSTASTPAVSTVASAPTAPKAATATGAAHIASAPAPANAASAPAVANNASAVAVAHTTPAPAATLVYSVSPADQNFRVLLKKWADREGWGYDYTLPKDVPIIGSDPSVQGPFKNAVRTVLRSTEMTAYPIKPCFYTNNFMRVVKATAKCDPST